MFKGSMDPATQLLVYLSYAPRREAFRAWVTKVEGHGYRAAHELVMALSEADNVATADTMVGAAEKLGIIERQAHDPGRELRFFGVGGRTVRKGGDEHSRPIEYGYQVGKRMDLVRLLVDRGYLEAGDFKT